MSQDQISENRRAIYYLGLGMVILAPVLCFGAIGYAFLSMGTHSMPNPLGIFVPFILGMILGMIGKALMAVGSRGLAGSGLKLDPGEAREDLKPWSKMAGGMLNDAGINLNLGQQAQNSAPVPDFDEKLRKLHQLHADGILTDSEYADQKAAVLEAMKK